MGLACGIFQFAMPILGWFVGAYCAASVASFDHWIAFGLLAFVGGNMIRGSFAPPEEPAPAEQVPAEQVPAGQAPADPTYSMTLLYVALATSIDALAVGASFALLQKPVLPLSIFAGIITALLCFGGVMAGRAAGRFLGKRVELAGGLILCLIGLDILRTHLWS
jgi:putative Mn2+ efflux pump MntP